ncbi:thermonuclease family protein [Escherichia coli]|nr:thermonuclease [Escherichia coli]EIA0494749.1 thermonuclease family protein [Escherichia coli]
MIKYIFALTLLLSGSVCADQIQGHVIRVLDGNTLEILQARHPVRIRLVNIDAPEKKQPFGRWSMNQLKSLVANTPVTVTYTQTDRYGRIPGRVYTEDGMEVNRWLVQHSAARVYPDFNTDYTLPAYQREARTMKRGLWADKKPVPPWLWRKENKNNNNNYK